MTTLEVDAIGEQVIRDHHAEPAFKNYKGFPRALCISVNDEVVHGIPSQRIIAEGDVLSVDCGVLLNGYYGDSAYTFAIGGISDEVQRLLEVTYQCLYLGIAQAVEGMRVGDISYAIQSHAENSGFGVVRELVGHGVGKYLHEKPDVPNFGKRGSGARLAGGMVIAIEPMINMGKKDVSVLDDKWTIVTKDQKPSAHYEHTVAVKKGKAEILSSFEMIEKAIEGNRELSSVNVKNQVQ